VTTYDPDIALRDYDRVVEELEETREALAELVRLKDGPRDDAYRAAKDAAWERAREVLP
jgi:hypothetical protein